MGFFSYFFSNEDEDDEEVTPETEDQESVLRTDRLPHPRHADFGPAAWRPVLPYSPH